MDLKDPIQVHLLTETALTDSRKYEILSQEEVDQLKKQSQSLTQRVESTRANLMIQSKYRDAAISMARLYAPANLSGKRRSLLGRHSGDLQSAREAEAERQASERKCEELASELFNLEKRLMEPQRRLLEHTAGILQLTHKASKKKSTPPQGQLINGMPGSPESLYTYSRNSMEQAAEGTYFDDTNMYHYDHLDDFQSRSQPRKNPIEIPLKSPIREQASQLRGEMDRVRDENVQLRNQTETMIRSISDMERRLETLNGSLRDAIVRFDPEKNDEYLDPPYAPGPGKQPGEMMMNHLDYLETGLFAIQAEQESATGGKEVENRIEALNRQVRDILIIANPSYPPAPNASHDDVHGQFAYVENALKALDSELERALDAAHAASHSNPLAQQDSDHVETVLKGLWDIIQSGFANIKQQKEERQRAKMDKGIQDENESEDEFDTEESYSLTGFSARVQWLYSQATTLKAQKSVLKRQIKQQRELNNKSDAEKDEEIQKKHEELEQSRLLLDRAEREALAAQTMLSETLEDLEEARELAGSAGETRAQLQQRNAAIAALEEDLREMQGSLSAAAGAHIQLEERNARVVALETDVRQLQENLAKSGTTQSQLDERNTKVAALEADLKQLQESLAVASIARSNLDERSTKVSALEDDVKKLQESLAAAEGVQKELNDRNRKMAALEIDLQQLQESLAVASVAQAQLEERNTKFVALEEDFQQLQEHYATAITAQAQLDERNNKVAALEKDLQQLHENYAKASTAQAQLDERNRKMAALEVEMHELQEYLATASTAQAQLDEKNSKISNLERDLQQYKEQLSSAGPAQRELNEKHGQVAALEGDIQQLREQLALSTSTTQKQVEERNSKIAALEAEVKRLESTLTSIESTSKSSQGQLAGVDSMIAALNMQLDDAMASKAKAEDSTASLRKQVEAQRVEIAERKKTLKVKEDELDLLNMNLVEIKTELTIAQAELDGAYGSRAERAADVAALKNSHEVTKLHNQVTKLKNELTGTVQELEDVTRETLAAEREKIELENKLDDAATLKTSLETEIMGLRDRLENETTKARDRIAKLQEELDGERLKASPIVPGRAGAGATMLSEQFRATMREERRKFQEEVRVGCLLFQNQVEL